MRGICFEHIERGKGYMKQKAVAMRIFEQSARRYPGDGDVFEAGLRWGW